MSQRIYKPRNVSVIMHHIVCPAKYRRAAISLEAGKKQYEIKFLEIGSEKGHARFLGQQAPEYSPASMLQKIKSVTARKIFETCPEVKKTEVIHKV
jgi:REP element-mobilizing transposase RayT